jgi:hypothetical protein
MAINLKIFYLSFYRQELSGFAAEFLLFLLFEIDVPKCPLPVGTSEGIFLRQTDLFKLFFLKNRVRFDLSIPNKRRVKIFRDSGCAFGCSQWE